MFINWQGPGWYVRIDPTAYPLVMARIDDGGLTFHQAQEMAKSQGYIIAVFYAAPPSYMTVVDVLPLI